MLGNHDLVRFGDLIERAELPGPDRDSYWARHEIAFAFMSAYSGPITFFYNEEIGAQVPGFAEQVQDSCWIYDRCDDHVSRIAGRISNFTEKEASLRISLTRLMALRDKHRTLSHGQRRHLYSDAHLFFDMKYDNVNQILCLFNMSNIPQSLSVSNTGLDFEGKLKPLLVKNTRFSEKEDQFQLKPFGYGFWALMRH